LLEELSRWSDHSSGREPEDDVTVVAIHSNMCRPAGGT